VPGEPIFRTILTPSRWQLVSKKPNNLYLDALTKI
jgi:hypothetical protein